MSGAPSDFDRSQEATDDFFSDDEDAEHEDDPMMDQLIAAGGFYDITQGADISDMDAEHDEVEEDDEDDHEPVGAVKLPENESEEGGDDDQDDGGSEEDESSDDSADSDKDSSEADSEVEREWEEASEGEEEEEAEIANPNRCIFCYEDEENDPSEEFEEYLACAVCGDNSHRQCARTENALKPDEDASKWRCPSCIENALEPDQEHEVGLAARRRSSAQITRDLLPSQRGASRPNSHSVFNQLIVNDDPMDGSRLLRKRKASTDEVETSAEKRRKRVSSESESESESDSSVSSPVENETEDKENEEESDGQAVTDTDKDGKQKRTEAPSRSARNQSDSPLSRPRPSRPRRPKPTPTGSSLVSVVKKMRTSFILAFHLDQKSLKRVLAVPPKPARRRGPGRPPVQRAASAAVTVAPTIPFTPAYTSSYATQFYSFHERENDELKSKPYGGILTEAEADTSKTFPQAIDRERFEEAKQRAEEEWKQKQATISVASGTNGTTEHSSHRVSGPASKIQCINFGGYEIDTWYAAPYPEEYSRNRVLYICEFCLKYMNSEYVAWRHKLKCPAKHPPGDEIYRDGSVSVFEVDGRKNPVYCQNLCLLAKLFLGSKTLYYDVEPFLFYVMTEYDELGCHFVGYFSKEKRPTSQNNVSCILTLPIHQRKGYGNLLIDFSYLLTRVEKKTGSPEKPLSDMGLVSYRNYWRLVLCYTLKDQKAPLSIIDISDRTGMTADDIVSALEGLRALVRDPITGTYALRLDYAYFRSYIAKWEAKGYVRLNPESLVWTPYIMGRSNLSQYNQAPALTTVAAREDEEAAEPEEGVQLSIRLNGAGEGAGGEGKSTTSGTPLPDGTPAREMDIDSPSAFMTNNFPTPTTEGDKQLTSSTTDLAPFTPLPNNNNRKNTFADSTTTATTITKTPSIPPTRFEIFPPLPGSRRRAGRPPASATRRRTTSATPAVARKETRGGLLAASSPPDGKSQRHGTPLGKLLRRTRSKMAETMSATGDDEDGGADVDKKEQEAEEEEEDDEGTKAEPVGGKGFRSSNQPSAPGSSSASSSAYASRIEQNAEAMGKNDFAVVIGGRDGAEDGDADGDVEDDDEVETQTDQTRIVHGVFVETSTVRGD